MPTRESPDDYPWTYLLNNNGIESIKKGDYNPNNILKVKNIVIGDEITSIAPKAFYDSVSYYLDGNRYYATGDPTIEKIVIGSGVKKIGEKAFACRHTSFLFNAATQNQTIEKDAFYGINNTTDIFYTKANSNFYKIVKNTTGTKTLLNDAGFVEIKSADDWCRWIMNVERGSFYNHSNIVFGRYALTSDIDFKKTISIPVENLENTYISISGIRPVVPYIQRSSKTKYKLSNITLFGSLNGNGHTIKNVEYGLFMDNYGLIKDLNIQALKQQDNLIRSVTTDDYYPGAVVSENHGVIEGVNVSGYWYGRRQTYVNTGYSRYYVYSSNESGGICGRNYGRIEKCHVETTLEGRRISGIAYENYENGYIYGCSYEGTIKNVESSALSGISFINRGTIQQCYTNADILNGGTVNSSASLVYTNYGTIKECSTEGSLRVSYGYKADEEEEKYHYHYTNSSKTDWIKHPNREVIETNYSKLIANNYGKIEDCVIGSAYIYTIGYADYKNANAKYNFYQNYKNTRYGSYKNIYGLKNEVSMTYWAGEESEDTSHMGSLADAEKVARYHTCSITKLDYVDKKAYDIQHLSNYYAKGGLGDRWCVNDYLHHDHTVGSVNTLLSYDDATSGNISKYPGLKKDNWVISKGSFPRPKDSLAVMVTGVKVNYLGDAIEGQNLDKSKIEFLIEYSNGTTYKLYGNSKDITFPYGVYVSNVGSMNTIYFTYKDTNLTGSIWPASGYDSFTVTARPSEPIEIVKVEYNGNPVTENMSYNLNDVRLTIKYDNGSIRTFTGASSSVGLTAIKDPKGDINLDGVVNQSDYAMLKNLITNGDKTLTAEQKAQADINGDGTYTTKDLSELSDILSRKVPYNKRIFYAKFSGIEATKQFTVASVRRVIDGIYVSNLPNKIKYIEGEDFNPKGMIITVKYDNGEYQTFHFANGDESFDGLTLGDLTDPITDLYTGQTKIPIYYEENGSSASTYANITVRQVTLTSIIVSQQPNTTTYYSGETFDERGMIITAFYDEGVYADGRDDDWSRMEEISINDCVIRGGERLLDSTSYVLIKAKVVDSETKDLYGYKRISKNSITSHSNNELILGLEATFEYLDGADPKSLEGTIVGNNYVTVSYTENNVTKSTIQPIQIEKKKLTKIDIYQMPHKVDYIAGDMFNSSGLIARAYYTDGTSEFIYEKAPENENGYEVVNGSEPLPVVSEMTIQYAKGDTTCYAKVPITVANNEIEKISAAYTGPTVDIGRSYMKNLVMINVKYKNGSVESFYADKLINGSEVVTIYRKGTSDIDTVIHKDTYSNVEVDSDGKYINHFTAVYAGFEADFSVTGVETITQLDFSESVAHGRRDAADWSERFRAVKIKTVYDYINQYSRTGDSGLATIEEKNPTGVVAEQINPLLWFEREGDWVEPVTNFIVEYHARTSGFLFPETGFNEDGSIKNNVEENLNLYSYQLPYLNNFRQNRNELRNPTQTKYEEAGWSDWVGNGDTVGTVNGRRVAYDYTNRNPETKTKIMYIDSAEFRLNTQNNYEFQADENPQLKIYVNGSATPYIVTKDNTVRIKGIQTMKIELAGKVRVRDNKGVENLHDFADVYNVGYKIGTANEPYEWNNGWVGTSGINAECFEVKIQLSTAPIDDFSFSTIPFIATQPEDTDAVIGNTAIFYVKAVGQNLSYQWYKVSASDNGNVNKAVKIGGATNYFYETPAVTKNDSGTTYYCIVKNGTGESQTTLAVLNARDTLPEITSNIEDQAIPDGQEYTFSVAATSKIPEDLRYQWEMTQADGTWQVIQPTSTNNSYTFIASSENHNRYIRCKITNSRGTVYSNPARISAVIDPVVELTSTATMITTSGSATFNAYITTYGGSPTYEWYIRNVTTGGSYELIECTDNKLDLSNMEAGEYKVKCVVYDTNGCSEDHATILTNDENALSIKVGDAPKLKSMTYSVTKTGTSSDITGTINMYKASFMVDVEHTDFAGNVLKYEWYKNGQLDGSSTSNTYKVEHLEESSQVAVMCRVSDTFGKSYKTIQFLVTDIPETIVK